MINEEFAVEWLHCAEPEVYCHEARPDRLLKPDTFNTVMFPFSDVGDTARLLKKRYNLKTYELIYFPKGESGSVQNKNGLAINTYIPSDIKPRDGHAAPWEQFLRHLIPDEKDRKHFERWFMTLVSCPHVKMKYGVLLISEQQSVGKSTLGEKILRPLVGEHNVSIMSESEIVDSNFNSWAAHKRLAITHEIYQGRQ